MGYLYLMMVIMLFAFVASKSLTARQGVIISSAVLPATLTLFWNKQHAVAACLSPILGLACSPIGVSICHISNPEDQSTDTALKLGL